MNTGLGLVLLVNLILLVIRYAYILFYPVDLAPDEALYWEYSRRLDISYYSKPPMVGYMIAVSTAIFGNTEFGVRFFPPLLVFILSFVVYKFTKDLYGDERLATIAAILPHFTIGVGMNAILMTIDAPFIFFYSIALWIIYRAVTTDSFKFWILAGLSGALAFLSKYTAVFLIPTALIFNWRLLLNRKFYWFCFLLSLAFLPVLIWNYKNDFVGMKHLFFLAGAKDKDITLTLKFLPDFIGGQIAILTIFPFFFMVYGWWKAFKDKDKRDLYLTMATLPVVLFFTLMSLKTRVYANWSAFPYMAGLILALRYMSPKWVKISFVTGFLLTLILHLPLPAQIDMKRRAVGWEELGRAVSAIYDPKRDIVIAPTYQLAAELAFYVKGQPYTYSVNLGRRMNDYDIWKKDLPKQKGKDAIFVSDDPLDERVRRAFDEVIFEGDFKYTYMGKVVRDLKLYKLKNFKGYIEEVKPHAY